jgi:hypothetical protein
LRNKLTAHDANRVQRSPAPSKCCLAQPCDSPRCSIHQKLEFGLAARLGCGKNLTRLCCGMCKAASLLCSRCKLPAHRPSGSGKYLTFKRGIDGILGLAARLTADEFRRWATFDRIPTPRLTLLRVVGILESAGDCAGCCRHLSGDSTHILVAISPVAGGRSGCR